jgi:hypothetical protein
MAEIDTLIDSLVSLTIKDGKVLNPKTKRWVKTSGKIGRQLISESKPKNNNSPNEPWDIHQWKNYGGYELAPGESVKVKGSFDNVYIVKRSQKITNSVYCSCPAWKYQRLNPIYRTCKHCQAVCGEVAESLRIKRNTP